jgi:hypothetical protein
VLAGTKGCGGGFRDVYENVQCDPPTGDAMGIVHDRHGPGRGRFRVAAVCIVAAASVAVLAAFTFPANEHSWGSVGDIAVITATPPVHSGVGHLVEELSIGGITGAEEYTFGLAHGIAVGADGSIYVADGAGYAIKQYDSTGKHVRSFGRTGQGPGEFGSPPRSLGGNNRAFIGPLAIGALSDGRLIVHAPSGHRVNTYDARGQPVQTRNEMGLERLPQRLGTPPLLMATRGDITYVRYSDPRDRMSRARERRPRGTYARWRADGTPIDTVPEPELPDAAPIIFVGDKDRPSRYRQVPYTPDHVWALSPLGYFVTGFPEGRGGQYSVELRLPVRRASDAAGALPRWRPGDPVSSIRIPYMPVPVSSGERADHVSWYTEYMRELDSSWRWNGPAIPAHKPAYKGLWVDGDGRIWISLHTPGRLDTSGDTLKYYANGQVNGAWPVHRWPEPLLFDVVEPGGRYLGKVSSVDMIHPQVARGNRLWAIVETEYGRLTVKRYRIVWGSATE